MIQPTTVFGRVQRHSRDILTVEPSPMRLDTVAALSESAACTTLVTPACLRTQYKMDNTTADPSVKTILGISGFLEVSATTQVVEENRTDLLLY